MSEVTHRRVLRGIPRWLLRGYLEDLGARLVQRTDDASATVQPSDDVTVEDHETLKADGWQARLSQLEDYRIGSLRSGQVEMVITGDASIVEPMLVKLEPRLFRGGG